MIKKYVNPYTISIIALILSTMSYLDIGFNQDLIKPDNLPHEGQEVDSQAFEQIVTEISGSKIIGGTFSSTGKIVNLDLENDLINISNGATNILQLGKLTDGKIGLLFNDSSGQEIGRIDENGLTILKGKISIQQENEKILIDNTGLVTDSVFKTQTVFKQADQSIIGDFQYQKINDLDLEFTLTRQSVILFLANIQYTMSLGGGTANPVFTFIVDSTNYFPAQSASDVGIYGHLETTAGSQLNSQVLYGIYTLPAGKHSANILAARSTPDETMTIEGRAYGSASQQTYFSYIILGSN